MKIIQVYQTNPFEEGQGGGVRYVKNLLTGLKSSCDSILFIGIGPKKKTKENISLIPITRESGGYIKFLFFLIIKLPFINLRKYDLVHVHRLYFAIPFIILKPNLKIICSLHGRTFSVFESNHGSKIMSLFKFFFKIIERYCIRRIDYLVPVSEDVVNSFKKKYLDFESYNQTIVGSMFDTTKFNIMPSNYLQDKFGHNNKYVLFLGRLADVKNIDFLIELWFEKYQTKSNIKLIIAGDGEHRNKLFEQSTDLCKYNSPIFLGEIKPNFVPNLISSANLCVLSSKHEASPTIIKESLSLGVPIVTNNVGDVKDYIVDRKNGIVTSKTLNDYENAINYFLKSNINKEIILASSVYGLEKCSIKYISSLFSELYFKLIIKQ
jgi:glycosyltransferase involved in cell wall biosynthesis